MTRETSQSRVRWRITVRGVVQGIGFRPTVSRLAEEFQLAGFVRNRTDGLVIEIEGDADRAEAFLARLKDHPPALAQIQAIDCETISPLGEMVFEIRASDLAAEARVLISPDVATCDECLAELFDPADRRYGYPFLNCTNCGPRLTIIAGSPYDRPRTSMAGFAMCDACRSEYENIYDRRYHAQPTACATCGPRLSVMDSDDEPIAAAIAAIRRGLIVAVKGLGGFHLACDARQEEAVSRLRKRKHRDEKPFAVMVANVEAARAICAMSAAEEVLLTSTARPIVLLRRRAGAEVASAIAPGSGSVGVMLPYTPVHHLLMKECDGPLVMTSGNRSDEPIVMDDTGATNRLRDIADLVLTHDRRILVRCDDSVARVVEGLALPIRRSRGEAPSPIALPIACRRPVLAAGGQLKSTFALAQESNAILSHHLGDLDHVEAFVTYRESIAHYKELFQIEPTMIAHDLHPDYASTRYAMETCGELPRLAVQHHHAHMASCMAENGLNERVIGVSFDGTGYGTDGAVWGGEFLVGDYVGFSRAAHLRYVPMPGGEQAIRQPWRMAMAHLTDAEVEESDWPAMVGGQVGGEMVKQMLMKHVTMPMTSSVGRLFDAVASLAGVRGEVSYEGQAAVMLEELAWQATAEDAYTFDATAKAIDTRPMVHEVVRDVCMGESQANISRRLHMTLVRIIVSVCERIRAATGVESVVLSGGVFVNALLLECSLRQLRERGFRVYRHHRVPPTDGGLSLGQAAVAAAVMMKEA